ncbi:hypothetical protein PAHAL_1G239500 [Panicum hallii]|jgi:hypothetical protein|uniref:F-box domain-containing protein n=1 Tax=Panicum hallii TaxID=206008 RepID=A0A2T8KWB3_9POAL|nr:hypothetical protein PAHAL_1G239500 [Panicum hallii]
MADKNARTCGTNRPLPATGIAVPLYYPVSCAEPRSSTNSRKERAHEAPAAAPGRGGDRIGALPDGVLEDILGFLPAQDAVRTCVLARRWRDLWKFAKALRVVGGDGKFLGSVKELREFVDYLLLSRRRHTSRHVRAQFIGVQR